MNAVCLIIPPSPFLADERVFPSLGILKVAAVLDRAKIPVSVLDTSGYANPTLLVERFVTDHPEVSWYGLTATTPQFPSAVSIRNTIKDVNAQATIALGGPHATMTCTGWKEDRKRNRIGRGWVAFEQAQALFDTVVSGDGEEAVFPALDGQPLVDADELRSGLFLKTGELEDYPLPMRSMIDLESYHYEIDGLPATSLIGQLGCPYLCAFCGGRQSASFRFIRTRKAAHVAAEVEHLFESYGYRGFMFYDDELNVTPTGLEDLCVALREVQDRLGVEMRFRGFLKAERFNEAQAKAMYTAGFRIVLSGVESGSDQMLTVIQKRTTAEINARCVRLAHDAGLQFKALMSLGHAGESQKTVEESIAWVLREQPDDVDWTVITQYPGSPYFDQSEPLEGQHGSWVYRAKGGEKLYSRELDYAKDAEFYKGVAGSYVSYVWTDHLSAEDLVRVRDDAERITRRALGLSPVLAIQAEQVEHSMGQLPPNVLKDSWKT